jgi:alpha-galactosidase/6-phospho-beta-glucosidase family protein
VPKVVFIGAESTVFARSLTIDLLALDALRGKPIPELG